MSPELARFLSGELGKFRTKRAARALGVRRDKKIAALMAQSGSRDARARALARFMIQNVFVRPEDDQELLEDYDVMLAQMSRAAAEPMRSEYYSAIGNEAQFLSVAARSVALVALAVGLWLMFVTEHDDRVCQTCKRAESEGPYPATDAPEPPLHFGCRCIVVPH